MGINTGVITVVVAGVLYVVLVVPEFVLCVFFILFFCVCIFLRGCFFCALFSCVLCIFFAVSLVVVVFACAVFGFCCFFGCCCFCVCCFRFFFVCFWVLSGCFFGCCCFCVFFLGAFGCFFGGCCLLVFSGIFGCVVFAGFFGCCFGVIICELCGGFSCFLQNIHIELSVNDGKDIRMLKKFLLALVACATFVSGARAEIKVDIIAGAAEPISVAVQKIETVGNVSGDDAKMIRDVVDADLKSTGLFRIVARDALPEFVEMGKLPDFTLWSAVKADVLVQAKLSAESGGRYNLEFYVWDVNGKEQIEAQSLLWIKMGMVCGICLTKIPLLCRHIFRPICRLLCFCRSATMTQWCGRWIWKPGNSVVWGNLAE